SNAGSFNGNISTWDVSSVMYMGSMFSYADSFNGDISAWEVSGVRNMSFMFSDAGSFNGNISTWDVSGVTDMYGMFTRTSTFNEDISGWDVSSVTDMSYMFSGAGSFNGDISTWEVSGVTDMSGMFYSAGSFNGNISTWDVSGVTNMSRMFFNAGSFNGGISTWEVSGVTNMAQMFRDASAFNQDLSGWCVEQIASEPNDFDYGANAWVLPKPNWGTCPAKELTIFGNAGWRMLSFPVGGVSVSSLAGQNLVQGVAGADAFYDDGSTYEEAAANLYYYLNTTADNWQEFDTFDAEISSGQGFIWYMFDNNNVNSVALPFTLSASGESPSADVTIPINPSDDFTLIGNPFKGNLNASDVSGWGDLQATARTWYPDAGAEGEYVNTTASTPSFTGFFVEKSESGSGDITIPVAAVSSKKADVESFRMALSLQGINENDIAISDHSTSVLFREGAAHKWDVYDATKLVPLLSSYATIGIVGDRGGEERVKAIASHPTDFEDALELPLAFNVSNFEGEFELSAEMESLPESWSVLLQDTETGETIDLRRASHSFNYQAESKAQKVSEIKYRMPDSYVMSAGEAIHRFTLTIEAGESVSTTGPGTELPQHVALNQNYPNPFNPSTAISYELPEASDVTLQVYDMTGRQIATLINREAKSAGRHTVQFDAGRLSSGVYIYRMKAGNTVITKKLTLIK
ncbi:MAG: BspA family leucine-rich repeat surface protein, partial [Balneolaceae bacterium]